MTNPLSWMIGKAQGIMPFGDWIGSFTDQFGLSDTGAQQRGLDALNSGMATANANLDANVAPVLQMYQQALEGRGMGDVLDTYRDKMLTTVDPASSDKVKEFFNPMYGQAVSDATNQALAGAGSSGLSTAGNNAIAKGVADVSSNMWQQALANSMQNNQNNQNVYGNIMSADLQPSQGWSQFVSDIAGSKYDAQVAQANAASQVAGQNRGWLSSIFNGVLG